MKTKNEQIAECFFIAVTTLIVIASFTIFVLTNF